MKNALRESAKYRGLYEVLRDEKFVGTSQKSGKSRSEVGRDDDKDEWDGTANVSDDEPNSETDSATDSATAKTCSSLTSSDRVPTDSVEEYTKQERPYRQGLVSETLPVLKAQALEKDSILNCDETWCRVKMQDQYKKAYIWCMVNKSAGIVIFFYDEGSRGRKVLTDFIGDADLAALQSDAYNVYKYLDGELSEVEHICCMAHVRAKFQKALLQGKDEQARPFMEWIGKLYDLERDYSNEHLPPDEIKKRRNGLETTEIIGSIWMELTRLLDDPLPKSDLITNALNYLKNAWTPVMAYRHDGRYCIDNSIAERSIRTMTIERKNKMAFGSHQGAETSTVYHTFTATCKMGALSFYQFLKNYFTAFMEGRTDFENLTPAILGKIN